MAIDDSLFSDGSDLTPIEKAILDWQNETIAKIQESLDNTTNGTTGMLRQSFIPSEIKREGNTATFEIIAEDYYKFVDEGVKGVGNLGLKDNNQNMYMSNAPNSPFSYKPDKKPSVKYFRDWAIRKQLNPFAVRESVFRKGLTPSYFYSKVMTDEWIDELSNRLETAGAGTVEIIIKESIENGK